jgi:hypothetical protein
MMTRIFNYANKILHLSDKIKNVTESKPAHDNSQYTTSLIVGCLMTMTLCRLGSFNSLEASKKKTVKYGKSFWGAAQKFVAPTPWVGAVLILMRKLFVPCYWGVTAGCGEAKPSVRYVKAAMQQSSLMDTR